MSTTNYTRRGDGKNRKNEEKERRRPLLEIAFERRKKLSEKSILSATLFKAPAKMICIFLTLAGVAANRKAKN